VKSFLLTSFAGLVVLIGAQTAVPTYLQWTAKSQREAEDKVAQKVDAIRFSAGLHKLKRVEPSAIELELICTAAATGNEVRDPRWGGLDTYSTTDLAAETETLKTLALGTALDKEGGSRREVYSDKDWPRYSLVVELDRTSRPDRPVFRVGVARRMSAFSEFVAPMTYDRPIHDSNDSKERVDPACRGLRR
jgi:hypothetical protein